MSFKCLWGHYGETSHYKCFLHSIGNKLEVGVSPWETVMGGLLNPTWASSALESVSSCVFSMFFFFLKKSLICGISLFLQ